MNVCELGHPVRKRTNTKYIKKQKTENKLSKKTQ